MSRVLTFSRIYPSHHNKSGKPTHFVEKVLNTGDYLNMDNAYELALHRLNPQIPLADLSSFWTGLKDNCFDRKWHTIRAGNRWKVGDRFSPRVWSGRPYASKQIILADDLEVKKVWDIEIDQYRFIVDGKLFYHQHVSRWHATIEELAQNDGLSVGDLFSWFKIPCSFSGQIICWGDHIHYP